jgi:tRNA pseudouridine55 synthase
VAKRRPPNVHGLLVIDKPAGMTSHDVVGQVRRRLGERRVGHAGTLDPDATGVLLVGVGSVTRLMRFMTEQAKQYTCDVVFGVETSTLDDSGEITATHEMTVSLDEARRVAAEHLTGAIMQVPPMVSAIRVGGRRLHELAREGIEVEREARPVTIHALSLEATGDPMVLRLAATCSSGTYVRTLAADLGRLLGGGAHLKNLRRTSIGVFDESEAGSIDEARLLSPAAGLRFMTQVVVADATIEAVRAGRPLPPFEGPAPWALVDAGGELLAVYEPFRDGLAKPAVVLIGAFEQ